jgi:hypothetical protein
VLCVGDEGPDIAGFAELLRVRQAALLKAIGRLREAKAAGTKAALNGGCFSWGRAGVFFVSIFRMTDIFCRGLGRSLVKSQQLRLTSDTWEAGPGK